MKPTVIMTPIGNARERFDAMSKGKPMPPRSTHSHRLPDDIRDQFLTALAKRLARQYIEDKEAGRV